MKSLCELLLQLVALNLVMAFRESLQLLRHRSGNKLQDGLAERDGDQESQEKPVDRSQQVRAQVFDVLAERHARIGKHIVGIGMVGSSRLHGLLIDDKW